MQDAGMSVTATSSAKTKYQKCSDFETPGFIYYKMQLKIKVIAHKNLQQIEFCPCLLVVERRKERMPFEIGHGAEERTWCLMPQNIWQLTGQRTDHIP